MIHARWLIAAVAAVVAVSAFAAPPRERQERKAYISNFFETEEPNEMAIIRWISQDGDGANTASWEGGVRPSSASDIALLDGIGSQVSWTSGMAGHGGAVIHSTVDYKGDIGSSGAYLTLVGKSVGPATIQAVFNHRGKLYVDMQKSGGGAALFGDMVIGMPLAGVDNAHVKGSFAILDIKSGGVTLDSTLVLNPTIRVFSGRVLITNGVSLQSRPSFYGGFIESDITLDPKCYGGRLLQKKLMTGFSIFGGHITYLPVPFSTGDMIFEMFEGSMNVLGNPADVFSAVTTGGEIGPNFHLIGVTDIPAVGRRDLREDFPKRGT